MFYFCDTDGAAQSWLISECQIKAGILLVEWHSSLVFWFTYGSGWVWVISEQQIEGTSKGIISRLATGL